MTYYNISEYLAAKNVWENTLASITNGAVTENGKSFSPTEYYRQNSRPVYMRKLKCSPDGTKIETGIIVKKTR